MIIGGIEKGSANRNYFVKKQMQLQLLIICSLQLKNKLRSELVFLFLVILRNSFRLVSLLSFYIFTFELLQILVKKIF